MNGKILQGFGSGNERMSRLKIGRYDVGFNAIYHIKDFPLLHVCNEMKGTCASLIPTYSTILEVK